jgi:hypothetical protein
MERDNLVDPHDTLHAVFAARLTGFTQIQKYPRSSVDPVTCFVRRADQSQQASVLHCSIRYRLVKPLVVTARCHIEYLAQGIDGIFSSVSLDELVGTSSVQIA